LIGEDRRRHRALDIRHEPVVQDLRSGRVASRAPMIVIGQIQGRGRRTTPAKVLEEIDVRDVLRRQVRAENPLRHFKVVIRAVPTEALQDGPAPLAID